MAGKACIISFSGIFYPFHYSLRALRLPGFQAGDKCHYFSDPATRAGKILNPHSAIMCRRGDPDILYLSAKRFGRVSIHGDLMDLEEARQTVLRFAGQDK